MSTCTSSVALPSKTWRPDLTRMVFEPKKNIKITQVQYSKEYRIRTTTFIALTTYSFVKSPLTPSNKERAGSNELNQTESLVTPSSITKKYLSHLLRTIQYLSTHNLLLASSSGWWVVVNYETARKWWAVKIWLTIGMLERAACHTEFMKVTSTEDIYMKLSNYTLVAKFCFLIFYCFSSVSLFFANATCWCECTCTCVH